MKKYNLYLWLAALVGLFASCSQDETDTLQTNESNRVSLTAELPDDFAQIGTRALPDAPGSHTLRCILEVWTTDQSPVLKHRQEQINLSSDHVEFNFTIDAGTYDCLFWADFIETTPGEDKNATIGDVTYTHYTDKYYATNTASGLKAISIITESYAFNTDARDAFFGKYKLTKGADAIENQPIPSLTRPFAKLTIKEKNTTNYDACNGLTAKYNVPTTFNVLKEAVEDAIVEVTCSNKSSESPILFSDYIFAGVNSTLGDVTLNFTGGKTFQDVTIPAGIPLKRNFRTNASGNLITEKPASTPQVKMTVTMDTNWGGEDVEEDLDIELAKEVLKLVEEGGTGTATDGTKRVFRISTEAQLRAMHVLIAGVVEMSGTTTNKTYAEATYKLTNDINLNNVPWTPIGVIPGTVGNLQGIFDGQGHTISGLNVSTTEQNAGFFGVIGPKGVVKHLAVKGTVTGPEYVGGIASSNHGIIAYCSFEGDVTLTTNTSGYPTRIGGIIGNNGKEITSCFANTTPEILSSGSGGASKGGIAGTAGTVQGCTWYYNNNGGAGAGAGIEACYQGWTSGTDSGKKNASYFDNSGLNSRVSDMNSYNAAYNYQWEVANGTLILKKKE